MPRFSVKAIPGGWKMTRFSLIVIVSVIVLVISISCCW